MTTQRPNSMNLKARAKAHRTEIRKVIFRRANSLCELQHRPDCIRSPLNFIGTRPESHGHMAMPRGTTPWQKYVAVKMTSRPGDFTWACWRCALLGPKRGSGRDVKVSAEVRPDWSRAYYGN